MLKQFRLASLAGGKRKDLCGATTDRQLSLKLRTSAHTSTPALHLYLRLARIGLA